MRKARGISRQWITFLFLLSSFCIVQAQSGMINIQIESIQPSSCNQQDGEIHITPLDGAAPYDYSINGGASFQADSLFKNLGIGTYIVLVRDAQFLISSYKLVRLMADGAPLIRGIVMSNPTECGIGGTLKVLAENGIPPLQYSIDNGMTFQESSTFQDVQAGTYNVVVRNSDESCSVTYPTISFAPESPINFINIQLVSNSPTCDSLDGSIRVNVSGGSGDYLFSLDDGENYQSSNLFNDLGEGSYLVVVKDTLSKCEKEADNRVTLASEDCLNCETLVVEVNQTAPTCDSLNGQIVVAASGASGGYLYSIDNGENFQVNPIFVGLGEGSYTITVRDTIYNCIKNAATQTALAVTDCPTCETLVVEVNQTAPTCDSLNGQIVVTASGASGGYHYSIDNGENFQISPIFAGLGEGNYNITVRDTIYDCTKNGDVPAVLTITDCPTCETMVIEVAQTAPNCDSLNGQIIVTASGASGGYHYSIDNGENFQTNPIFAGLGEGNYNITVRDTIYDCTKNGDVSAVLTITDCPTCETMVIEVAQTAPNCDSLNGQIEVTASGASGGYHYSIDNGENFQISPVFAELGEGDYTIVVRDTIYDCTKNAGAVTSLTPNDCSDCDDLFIQSFISIPQCDSLNGQIELTVNGGSRNYLISVNGGAFESSLIFENLGEGDYTFTVRDTINNCEKMFSSINLTAETCDCSLGLFDNQPINLELTACDIKGEVCIDIGLETLMGYEILDNGTVYNGGLMGCNFDTMLTYLYFTLPGQGLEGPYHLDRWELNDSIYTGEFKDIRDLVEMMNAIDTLTTWTRDSVAMTLKGGNPDNEYGAFEITQIGTNMIGVLQLSTNFIPMSSQLSLEVGNHNLIFRDKNTDCKDTLSVNVECIDCPQINLTSSAVERLEDCTTLAIFCFEGVTATDLENYTITKNGLPFEGGFGVCDSTVTGFSIALDTGRHELIYTHNSLACSDTFLINVACNSCPTLLLKNELTERASNCDTTVTFCFEGISPENLSIFTITDNGAAYNGPIGICDSSITGFSLELDTGQHQIIIENLDLGCQFIYSLAVNCQTDTLRIDTIIEVGQIDTICFAELLMEESVVSISPTCEGQSPSVGFEINNLTNCLIYEGLREGMDTICIEVCLEDNICTEVIITVTVIVEDTICQDIFSSTMADVMLEDCDSTGLFCLNIDKSELSKYSMSLNGGIYEGDFVDCDVPEQASLELAVDTYEIILSALTGDCSDTINVMVQCEPEMDVFMDTVIVNTSDTFCIDSTGFAGDLVSIKNLCEDQAGEFVIFDIDTLNYCLSYTGVEEGRDTACIEVCDNLGTCDTTTVIISVEPEPDTIPLPIAVNDVDTVTEGTKKTINILGNDTTNSTLITVIVLEEPENGMVTVNADMTVTYMSMDTSCGVTDSFTYELCNPSGCDTAKVELYIECKSFQIFNGFSPNLDGVNETFTIDGIEDFPNNRLIIFNRWGNKVFEQKGYKGQWNGTWNNKILPDGTYYYLLNDGEGTDYSGFLQIKR